MAAYMDIELHNDMGHPQWFTVTDNVSGKQIFDDNMDTDETKTVSIARGADDHGDITYVPKGYAGTHKDGISEGDFIEMS